MRPGEHQRGVVLTGAEVEEPGRGEAPEALGVVAEARVLRVLLLRRKSRGWRHESKIHFIMLMSHDEGVLSIIMKNVPNFVYCEVRNK